MSETNLTSTSTPEEEEEFRKALGGDQGDAANNSSEEKEEEENEEEEEEDEESGLESAPEGETPEEAAARRKRNKRKAQRDRAKRQRDLDRKELIVLRNQVQELSKKTGEQSKVITAVTNTQVETHARELVAQFERHKASYQEAEREIRVATETGDGDALVKALAKRDAAIEAARGVDAEARAIRERVARGQGAGRTDPTPPRTEPPRAPPPAQPEPVLDPRARELGSKFMKENSWFNTNGSDVDSKILLTIDQQVAEEGFDPGTEDYWEEVKDRARQYLPHRFKAETKTRRTPPTGGTGGDGNQSSSFNLSAERVKAMKEAGVWDDPAKRKVYIDRFKEYDKNNRS